MSLWIASAVLTLIVLVLIGVPLWRGAGPRATTGRRSYDMQVFRDQLAEVDNDEREGLMNAEAAEAARTEIKRRMLAADNADPVQHQPGRSRALAVFLVVVIPVAAFGTYSALGNPGKPDRPYAERDVNRERRTAAATGEAGGPGGGDPEAAIDRLRQRLDGNPEDAGGWRRLARAYARTGRWEQAAAAWQSLIDHTGATARARAGLGIALVRGRDGRVPARAMVALAQAMKMGTDDPRAPFHLGLGLAQQGRVRAAAGLWKATLEKAPEGAPWANTVRQTLQRAAGQLDTTPSAIEPATPDYDRIIENQKSAAEDEQTIDEKAADLERRVGDIVERLEKRVEDNPESAQAWKRLGRAAMIGERYDKAVEAFDSLVALKPKAPGPRLLRARALLSRAGWQGGDEAMPDPAVAAVEAALARGSTAAEALFLGGVAAQQKGNTDKARERLERAREAAGPDNPVGKAASARLEALADGRGGD